jgi:hypothetical protein
LDGGRQDPGGYQRLENPGVKIVFSFRLKGLPAKFPIKWPRGEARPKLRKILLKIK